MADNLLDKASILLTPTAYNDGRMLSVKPEVAFGEELSTNGDFSNGTTGWSNGSSTLSVVDGKLKILATGAFSYARQNITVVSGKKYKITVNFFYNSLVGNIEVYDGTTNTISEQLSEDGVITLSITPSSTNLRLTLLNRNGVSGDFNYWDNVSVVEDLSGDFTFSRSSAATRVNAQGLVENVQILSPELVSNGNFSQIGTEEVSNGNFSQEGSELITNGGFDTDSGWVTQSGWSISGGTANCDGTANNALRQNFSLPIGTLRIKFDVTARTQGIVNLWINNPAFTQLISADAIGSYEVDVVTTSGANNVFFYSASNFIGSIDNVSVKEVGQDWNLGTGWSIGDDKAVFDDTTTNRISQTGLSITSGKSYKINFTIADCPTTAHMTIYDGGGSDLIVPNENYVNGSYTRYYTATTNETGVSFWGNTAGDTFTITNISVKEVGQDWTLGTGWSIGEDKAICDGTQTTFTGLIQDNVFTSGKTYKLTFNIVSNSQQFNFWVNGSQNIFATSFLSDGFKDYTFTASASGKAYFEASSSFVGSVTNISVKEITDDTDLPRINYEGFSYQDSLGSEEVVNGDFST